MGLTKDQALALGELPPASTERWTFMRKRAVANAIVVGAITRAEACKRYGFSYAEITDLLWRHRHGLLKEVLLRGRKCVVSNEDALPKATARAMGL